MDIFTPDTLGEWQNDPAVLAEVLKRAYQCGREVLDAGEGGGIACGVRGRLGIGVYGPALDDKGNSVAGIAALEYLSRALHLHAFDYHPYIEDE